MPINDAGVDFTVRKVIIPDTSDSRMSNVASEICQETGIALGAIGISLVCRIGSFNRDVVRINSISGLDNEIGLPKAAEFVSGHPARGPLRHPRQFLIRHCSHIL